MQDVPRPELKITENALRQILLIQRHDYTLEGMEFRIKIGGKGCGGFTYATGFSERLPEDIVLDVQNAAGRTTILMDRFTAYYTRNAQLEHKIDHEQNEDGFEVMNPEADLYQGKFFKNPNLVPNWNQA